MKKTLNMFLFCVSIIFILGCFELADLSAIDYKQNWIKKIEDLEEAVGLNELDSSIFQLYVLPVTEESYYNYGTRADSIVLKGGSANWQGHFKVNSNQILSVGRHQISISFIPDDPDYGEIQLSEKVSVQIIPAVPTLLSVSSHKALVHGENQSELKAEAMNALSLERVEGSLKVISRKTDSTEKICTVGLIFEPDDHENYENLYTMLEIDISDEELDHFTPVKQKKLDEEEDSYVLIDGQKIQIKK